MGRRACCRVSSTRSSGRRPGPATPTSCSRRVATEVGKAVPYDGAMWFGVDPTTLLAVAPARMEHLDDGYCNTFWHGEFHEHDANLFGDLAREPVPAATLRSGDERPPDAQRPLPRLHPAAGLRRRAARRVPDRRQHVGRRRPVPRAGPRPVRRRTTSPLLAAVSPDRRRRHPHARPPCRRRRRGFAHAPGLLLFDRDGAIVSANAAASCWLAEIYGADADGDDWSSMLAGPEQPRPRGGRPDHPAARPGPRGRRRPRRRARPGCGSATAPVAGSCSTRRCSTAPRREGHVAVVVEPAKSADIAPIIIEAYGLTPRERDVVRAIARGSLDAGDRRRAVPVRPHRARLHQVGVREGRRQQPRRARRQALRRALRRPVPRDARRGPLSNTPGEWDE